MADPVAIGAQVERWLVEALDAEAASQGVSRSAMLAGILARSLRARGYQPPDQADDERG